MDAPEHAARTLRIVNVLGLHARAATKLVHLASRYPCEVELEKDGQVANAKSVMGVLLLCGAQGSTIEVRATGERAHECVEAIAQLVADKFGEGA